jgi:hypothetical protein
MCLAASMPPVLLSSVQSVRAFNFFFNSTNFCILQSFKDCFEPGQYYLVRAFQHCFAFRPQIRRNPHGWCSDFDPSRRMPNYFQNSDHQYRIIDFCLRWKYYMAMVLSAEHAPPPRIIAYEWIKPRCPQSFSNIMAQPSYDVHRYHARNVGTLCASLTMRREIVATRRAGLTTAVIKRIPPKGKQCAWCIHIMPMTEELF